MRKTRRRWIVIVAAALAIFVIPSVRRAVAQQSPAPSPSGFTGTWEAANQPASPWIFNLRTEGNTLTGQVWEESGLTGPSPIFDGRIDGDRVTFKYRSLSRVSRVQQMLPALAGPPPSWQDRANATLTVTLTGKLTRNQIDFTSSVDDPENIGGNTIPRARATTSGPGGSGVFGRWIAGRFTVARSRTALTGRVVVEGGLPRPVFQFRLVNAAGDAYAPLTRGDTWRSSPPGSPAGAVLASRTGSAFDIVPRLATNTLPGNPPEFIIRLPPGEFRPRVAGLPSGYQLKSIEAGSQNLITGSLKISSDVAPPELVITLALTAEPSWVAVRGRVINATQRIAERGGQTVGTTQSPPTAVVLVSSVFSEFWIAPVESDGTFNFARVLPGRYEVRGFPDTTNTPSMDVNIGRSAVVNIDLTLPNVRAVPCPAC